MRVVAALVGVAADASERRQRVPVLPQVHGHAVHVREIRLGGAEVLEVPRGPRHEGGLVPDSAVAAPPEIQVRCAGVDLP